METPLLLLTSALLAVSSGVSSALSLPGMDDNCILSFVVPRDKMKSSCQLDDKVSRRLNTAEMKVNIYTQQVTSLQQQLDKQRQHDAARIEKLEQQLKTSTAAMNNNFLVERRLALLEKEFEMLHHDMNLAPATPRPDRQAGEARRAALRQARNNEIHEEPSRLSAMVSGLVKAEIKAVMENYTKQFEKDVRQQILTYIQVYLMVNKRKTVDPSTLGRSGDSTIREPQGDESVKKDWSQSKQYDVKEKEISSAESEAQMAYNRKFLHTIFANESDLIVNEEILADTNFSYSGDNPEDKDSAGDTFTKVTSGGASSRISSNPVKPKNSTSTDDKYWEDNMIRDQPSLRTQGWIQDEIKKELTYSLAEVVSLFKKHSTALESRLKHHESAARRKYDDVNSHLKGVDQNMRTIGMHVDSLSQSFNDYSQVLNRFKPLEAKVETMQKHFNNSYMKDASAIELDEQTKKTKKLERLLGVYHQSLEHYRNETKLEYRELHDKLNNDNSDSHNSANLKEEMTAMIESSASSINKTIDSEINKIFSSIQDHDDSYRLIMLDISAFEHKLNTLRTKVLKYDKKFEERENKAQQMSRAQRDLRKKVQNLEKNQSFLGQDLNNTAHNLFSIETLLKLDVLDEWLPMNFQYDTSRTECFGDQYVRRSNYKDASMVGVILCSPTRYKILLARNLNSVFQNIGDEVGWGEDHCEFVRARTDTHITLSPFAPMYGAVQGFVRSHWGEEPRQSFVNTIKPSPKWYECGISIP